MSINPQLMNSIQSLQAELNKGYRSNPLLDQVRPHVHEKQRWFLSMDHLEVLYGGAAGGGKSDALLASALQYIDVPGYAAILFRRTFADLNLEGSLMRRAEQWLTGTVMRKHDGGKKWTYPNGGTLEFGYLADEGDWLRYQSAEYQFCGFDELTQLPEIAYTYLFSRLRKPSPHCPLCFDSPDATKRRKPRSNCTHCHGTGFNPLHSVPLRQRAASNPGGVYGEWVKRHFVTKSYLNSDADEQFTNVWVKRGPCIVCSGVGTIEVKGVPVGCPVCNHSGKSERYFLPARLEDNLSVDQVSYERSLAMLPAQQRAQLRQGRWDFMSDGSLFLRNWIRNFTWRGEHLELQKVEGSRLINRTKYSVFLTADTASKTKTTNDYTVLAVWAMCHPGHELCLLEVFRSRILVPEILPQILRLAHKWHAEFVIIEEASSGIAIIQEAQTTERGKGITVLPYNPHVGDKVARSHEAQIRMQGGQIFFPITKDETIAECINELLLFYTPDVHDDFVDNLTMAAWYASGKWRNMGLPGKPGAMIRKGCPLPNFNRFRQY